MPSIRIQFPEKDHPQTIVLRGSRITIGRLPSNTIQISDRSVSGRHAELVQEGDHYRIQDAGSTNGTYFNGHRVSDYHLHESGKITFGTLECEFDAVAGTESAEGMESCPPKPMWKQPRPKPRRSKTRWKPSRANLNRSTCSSPRAAMAARWSSPRKSMKRWSPKLPR
ncbi:MAG: FHA domain-containing protein [Chthoniobacteraceae bacterium]